MDVLLIDTPCHVCYFAFTNVGFVGKSDAVSDCVAKWALEPSEELKI